MSREVTLEVSADLEFAAPVSYIGSVFARSSNKLYTNTTRL